MPCSTALYPLILCLLQTLHVTTHRTSTRAIAQLVSALLVAQSLRPTPLARVLTSAPAVLAAQRYRRLRRLLDSPALTPARLTPALVRATLALSQPQAPVLVLDTVRCGGWEVFTVGLALPGRVQLLSYALLPYPWPKGQFAPTSCQLLRTVAACWPEAAPRPHLVADRFFPSYACFQTLDQLGWEYTVRLRAQQTVTLAGVKQPVRTVLATAVPECWSLREAAYGCGARAIAGRLVVGQGLLVVPWHQRDAGSARGRQRRAAKRAYQRKERRWPQIAQTDAWVVLFTTARTWRAALAAYRQRYHTEASYRDLQGGVDGRQGWDLEPVLQATDDAVRAAALVGLALLAQLLQQWLGAQVGQPGSGVAQHLPWRWSVHGRLSLFTRGRLLLQESDPAIQAWCQQQLQLLLARLTDAPPTAAVTSQPLPLAA